MTAIDALTQPNTRSAPLRSGWATALMLAVMAAAAAAGVLATSTTVTAEAAAAAGADLTYLLRFMAGLKAGLAVGAAAALLWRLGAPVSPLRYSAYAAAAAGMAAGPGLIWGMAHVGLGALLLHGGLLATALLLWFDPATAAALDFALRRTGRRRPARDDVRPTRLGVRPRPHPPSRTPAVGGARR